MADGTYAARPLPRSQPRCCPPRPWLREGGGELPRAASARGSRGKGRASGRGRARPGRGAAGCPRREGRPGAGEGGQRGSSSAGSGHPPERGGGAGTGLAAKPRAGGWSCLGPDPVSAPAGSRSGLPRAGCCALGLPERSCSRCGSAGVGRRSPGAEFARVFVRVEITFAKLPLNNLQLTPSVKVR